jgi:hypothetical protein
MDNLLVLGYLKYSLRLHKKFRSSSTVLEGLTAYNKILEPDLPRFRQDFEAIVKAMPYQPGSVVIIIHFKNGLSKVIAVIQSNVDLKSALKLSKQGNLREWVKSQFTPQVDQVTFQLCINDK